MASPSQALVFMVGFNHPGVCWRDSPAWHCQSRRFLECVGDFLLQVTAPLLVCSVLHLAVTSKEGLLRNVKLQGSLCCSSCQVRCQESRFWPGVLWDNKPRREEGPKKTGSCSSIIFSKFSCGAIKNARMNKEHLDKLKH